MGIALVDVEEADLGASPQMTGEAYHQASGDEEKGCQTDRPMVGDTTGDHGAEDLEWTTIGGEGRHRGIKYGKRVCEVPSMY